MDREVDDAGAVVRRRRELHDVRLVDSAVGRHRVMDFVAYRMTVWQAG